MPDPRARRGRRHTLASVLLTAACAVLAGARSYIAIGQWARHAPHDTLARLGFHARGSPRGASSCLALDRAPGAGSGVSRRPRRPSRTRPGRHGVGRGRRQDRPRLTHRNRPGRPPPVRRHGRRPDRQPAPGTGQKSSSRGEFRPPALTEPCVKISLYTALAILITSPRTLRWSPSSGRTCGIPLRDLPHLPQGLAQRREPLVLLADPAHQVGVDAL
ncbi:transposase family protein [Streptomyces sp. NPDC085929]|uniref:transposase family protein n=1 Tax=Streptomyces sp. NPDC085929 TaxID=3365739 RepID=UPI0037D46652